MEVLMAVMIMAIGVVSVATMFPLSIVRSVQATQLTSATVLRYNAESLIDSNKLIVFDPDRDRVANSPLIPYDQDGAILEHYNTVYMIDPAMTFLIEQEALGLSNAGEQTALRKLADSFGNDGNGTPYPAPIGGVLRYPGIPPASSDLDGDGNTNINDSIVLARHTCGLPDTWTLLAEGVPTVLALDRKSVSFADEIDLSSVPTGTACRALVFDITGRQSQSRFVKTVNNLAGSKTIAWHDRLPNRLTSVGNVRIELQESRYTWMLTVRRQARGDADIDVVCFQGRSFAVKDEQAFRNQDSGNPANPVFQQHSDTAVVKYARENMPWIHKGGYVFDLQNAHWYRIQGFKEEPVADDGTGRTVQATIQLNQKASGQGKWAIFMRGVVDVYPIGVKSPTGIDLQ